MSRSHCITLRRFVDADFEILARWLCQEHIRRWYTEPEEWLYEIRFRHESFAFIHHMIACIDGEPIGFGQYYRCEASQEPEYQAYWSRNAHSVDYLIGERAYLGKGVGKGLVNALADMVFEQTDAQVIVAQPDRDNVASRATLLSSHFTHDVDRDLFVRWRDLG